MPARTNSQRRQRAPYTRQRPWRPRVAPSAAPLQNSPSVGATETATLRIVRPRAFAELSAADFVDMMRRLVEQREEQHRLQAAASERGFLGAAAVLAQAPHDSPATVEDRRTLNPRLAAKNKWRRIEAIKRVADFVTRHREAFRRWCAGERDVVFPAGTYQMRVVHKVAVADSG